MATDSEWQSITFAGELAIESQPKLNSKHIGFGQYQRFLRRANKPQKCFVSGETESVANTSAFVGPVALVSTRTKQWSPGLRRQHAFNSIAVEFFEMLEKPATRRLKPKLHAGTRRQLFSI